MISPSLPLLLLLALVGILVGGVLNALSDDLPERRQPRLPHYPDNTPRPPIAWLGITAFLTGNRASSSGAKLTWRYPLTEISTALLLMITALSVANNRAMTTIQFVLWLVYMALFVLITVIDLEHRLILYVVILPSIALGFLDALLGSVVQYGPTLREALIGGAVGFGVFFLLYLGGVLFSYISSQMRGYDVGVAFGFGDVMLITFCGLILGWQALLFAMYITVFAGAIGSVAYLVSRNLRGGKYRLFTALPYGPYIVFGTIIMLLFNNQVLQLFGFQ